MEHRREAIMELFGVSDCLVKSRIQVKLLNTFDFNVDAWQADQIGDLSEDEAATLNVVTVLAEKGCQLPFTGSPLPLL